LKGAFSIMQAHNFFNMRFRLRDKHFVKGKP